MKDFLGHEIYAGDHVVCAFNPGYGYGHKTNQLSEAIVTGFKGKKTVTMKITRCDKYENRVGDECSLPTSKVVDIDAIAIAKLSAE